MAEVKQVKLSAKEKWKLKKAEVKKFLSDNQDAIVREALHIASLGAVAYLSFVIGDSLATVRYRDDPLSLYDDEDIMDVIDKATEVNNGATEDSIKFVNKIGVFMSRYREHIKEGGGIGFFHAKGDDYAIGTLDAISKMYIEYHEND